MAETEYIKGAEIICRRDREGQNDFMIFLDQERKLIMKINYQLWKHMEKETQSQVMERIQGFFG